MNMRKYSKKQEEKVAKDLGGKVVANSGASAFHKGDVALENMLLECKTVTKDQSSVSIKKEWLEKTKQEAFVMRKDYYALAIQFGPNQENYYIVPQFIIEEFIEQKRLENE